MLELKKKLILISKEQKREKENVLNTVCKMARAIKEYWDVLGMALAMDYIEIILILIS